MSVSPAFIGVFVGLAVALKLAILTTICIAAWRRAPRFPVAGTWRLRNGDGECPDGLPRPIHGLLDRHGGRIRILPSLHTVTVVSEGASENYGALDSPVERPLPGGLFVRASSSWLGDMLSLESDFGAAGKVVETYSPSADRRVLNSKVRVLVPAGGVDRTFVRTYEAVAAVSV